MTGDQLKQYRLYMPLGHSLACVFDRSPKGNLERFYFAIIARHTTILISSRRNDCNCTIISGESFYLTLYLKCQLWALPFQQQIEIWGQKYTKKLRLSPNGTLSEIFLSEMGVSQGENLSPSLFSIYLNDLQSFLGNNGSVGVELRNTLNNTGFTLWLKILILIYADDRVLLSNSEKTFKKV